jgi:hypothetical protein
MTLGKLSRCGNILPSMLADCNWGRKDGRSTSYWAAEGLWLSAFDFRPLVFGLCAWSFGLWRLAFEI